LLPVNKYAYIILNVNPPPIVDTNVSALSKTKFINVQILH